MADFTGLEEQAYILGPNPGIGDLCSGRVWETQAPDYIELPRDDDGRALPYLVVTFQTPFASSQGRSIAVGEQRQPYMMAFMVTALSGDVNWSKQANAAVSRRLVGARPSDTAGEIKSVAGFSYFQSDTASRPTRFSSGTWFQVPINLAI